MIPKDQWEWRGEPMHFILNDKCHFHLATIVGKYLISTVGDLHPNYPEDLQAKLDKISTRPKLPCGAEEIGCDRFFESMVFTYNKKGSKRPDGRKTKEGIKDLGELDFRGYQTSEEATKGHMELCEIWAAKQ